MSEEWLLFLGSLVFIISIIYFIFMRRREKNTEHFEKRR